MFFPFFVPIPRVRRRRVRYVRSRGGSTARTVPRRPLTWRDARKLTGIWGTALFVLFLLMFVVPRQELGILAFLDMVIGVGFFVHMYAMTTRPARVQPTSTIPARRGRAQQAGRYGELLSILLGDRRRAEWLIAYEQTRNPGASRGVCIDRAIERLRRDIGR